METAGNRETYFDVQPRPPRSILKPHRQLQQNTSGDFLVNEAEDKGEFEEGNYEYVQRPDDPDYAFSGEFRAENLVNYDEINSFPTPQGLWAEQQAMQQMNLLAQADPNQIGFPHSTETYYDARGDIPSTDKNGQINPLSIDNYYDAQGSESIPIPTAFAPQIPNRWTRSPQVPQHSRKHKQSSDLQTVTSISIKVQDQDEIPPPLPPHSPRIRTGQTNLRKFFDQNFRSIVIILLIVLIVSILLTALVVFLVAKK